jgi:hypothetical protein
MTAADSHPNRLASNSVRGGTGAALIGTGGALLAISPALPWVHVVLLGDLTLFQLLKFTRHSTGFGWAAVLVGSLFVLVALGVRHSRDWLRLMSFLLAAVVALVAGPGTARLVDLVSHSGGFLGVGAGVIVIALGEIMLLAGAIAPSVETAARVRSAASASDQAPIVGAISVVMAEAAEIAAPSSASNEPRSQEQAKPPAVDEASEREAAPPRGSPAPQRVVNDEPTVTFRRRTVRRAAAGAIVLTLLVAGGVGYLWGHNSSPTTSVVSSSTTTTEPMPLVLDCSGTVAPRFEPSVFTIECGTGGIAVTGITWTFWNAASASGSGTLKMDTCNPNCASGGFTSTPTRILLGKPAVTQDYGLLFTSATITALRSTFTIPAPD